MLNGSVCPDPASARSAGELGTIAIGFANAIGCAHFSYLVTRPPQGRVTCENVCISSYAPEWIGRYLERNYKLYDPVATLARKSRMPYLWGQRGFLGAYEKAARYVFHEAAEFGILEGYSVPVVGPERDSAIFSVAVDARSAIADIVRDKAGDIQLFAAKFHDAAMRLEGLAHPQDRIELTTREQDVLTWTAEGYSSDEVGARLGLSASAVNYHITNCCRKLGAGNKVQAVAMAIRLNLL